MQFAVVEWVSNNVDKLYNNQSHLRVQDRIKPSPALKLEKMEFQNSQKYNSKNEEMIYGLPNKLELNVFFLQKDNYFKTIIILLQKFNENLWDLVEKNWNLYEGERKYLIQEKKNQENFSFLKSLKYPIS